jgi:Protein of unknown function (DUF1822)
MTLVFADPAEWWLEVSPTAQATAWQQSQRCIIPRSQWNTYLNCVCLNAVLSWLQAESTADVEVELPAVPAVWDVMNGTAIRIGTKRCVVLPSEAIDSSELEVPQEWVDIPNWAADYYLAVQVKLAHPSEPSLETQWLRVWGYTTHGDLKTIANYDPVDRTYCLEARSLTTDLNAFWVTLQFCPEAQTRAAIAPLPELTAAQAQNLLQRLGNGAIAFPRLAVPFTLWGALLEQESWHQELYQRRTQQRTQRDQPASVISSIRGIVHLSQWLQRQVEAGWLAIEALYEGYEGATPELSFRSNLDARESEITQGKLIELSSQSGSQTVMLRVGLTPEVAEQIRIVVQLHPSRSNVVLPANLTLSLLSDTGAILQSVQTSEQDNYIQLRRFRCSIGTTFSLQILWEDSSVVEDFIV